MARKSKEGRDIPHLRIRLAPQLLARLEKAREKTGATMNGEIVARLENSFGREDYSALVHQAVEEALRLLEGAARQRASTPEPAPPSYTGILGQLTQPSRPHGQTKPAALATDISELPPDTPISALTPDHLDQLRRRIEEQLPDNHPTKGSDHE